MKIYEINTDSNNIQWVMPNVSDEKLLDVLKFDCVSKKDQYDDITWYIYNPKDKRGNFYMGIHGALVFDQAVYDSELFTLFEMAGEILSVNLETGEKLYALNILECVNMLNVKNTVYDIYDNGTNGRILNYSFHENRISESSIFKIPDNATTTILTYSDIHDEDDEFYHLYKSLNFTGLLFEEIYSS